MNHSNNATMAKERITVVVNSSKAAHEMAEPEQISYTSDRSHSKSSKRDDGIKRSKSAAPSESNSNKSKTSNSSQRRSQSTTREVQSSRVETLALIPRAPRTPNTEPDLVISVGDQDFHYFSPMIAYMSDYLSQQMVQVEDEKLRIDFSHKNAKEWEQYIYPLLEKHSRGKRSKNSSPCVNQSNVAIVLPWFQEFGLQALLRDCDELLTSLPFVTPGTCGSSMDHDESMSDVSGQDVRDAVSLLNIAFSCTLPQAQARAADLVHKYLQHSPKTWLLVDDQGESKDDEEDDDDDGGEQLSIFVRLAQILHESPTCREFLFSRYNPNILELYLPTELIPCDKESQSHWFWEELVANPLFPYLLRERVKSGVHQIEKSQTTPIEQKPSKEPEPPKPVEDEQPQSNWLTSWIPGFQRQSTVVSPQATDDDGDEDDDDTDDDDEEDDDSVVNERSHLIHDVLDKIREPQHNFPRRPRSITTLTIASPNRRHSRLTASMPPPMPVLHERNTIDGDAAGFGETDETAGTPVRLHKPVNSNASIPASGSPKSTASTDNASVSSGSLTAPSIVSRRTFTC
jgi:hypothetical protein